MLFIFRLIYAGAALLAIAVASLIVASLFMAERASRSMEFLDISLVVGAVFIGVGVLLIGIRRHVVAIATLANGQDGTDPRLAAHINRLLAHLLAAGASLVVVLGLLTYGIVERINQGFAVFG
jgi:hypothetical protein